MRVYDLTLPLLSLAALGASAAVNTSQEFRLVTKLKQGSEHKTKFANLELEAFHSGAGV